MKQKSDILERVNRNDGIAVPEGFFEDFAKRMAETLPQRPEAEQPAKIISRRTVWGRIRPYVYMAAMFAGIWCMLKMFSLMGSADADLSIDRNQVLTEALSDDSFIYDYIINDVNSRELMDEIYDDSISVDELLVLDEETSLPASDDVDESALEVVQ